MRKLRELWGLRWDILRRSWGDLSGIWPRAGPEARRGSGSGGVGGGESSANLGLRLEGLEGRVPEPGSRPDSSCSSPCDLGPVFLSPSFPDRSGEMEAGRSAESWYQ